MNAKILIVDDSKTYLALAASALKEAGFDIFQSETIWISRLISQHRPDLVLMDVTIGSSNGASAVSAIKKRNFGHGIKIFLHSSEPHNVLSQISDDCGADGFIVKDGKSDSLVGAVKKALGRH
ncbi:MAG TPA: response regulator [Pseudomonadales bacterium]